jgi:hypothetical protein
MCSEIFGRVKVFSGARFLKAFLDVLGTDPVDLVVGANRDTQRVSGIRNPEAYCAVHDTIGSLNGADWRPVLSLILFNDKLSNMVEFCCLRTCGAGMVS